MKKKLVMILAGVMVMSSCVGLVTFADDTDQEETRPVMTEEMKENFDTIKELVKTLKEEGKTREEIKVILEEEGYTLSFANSKVLAKNKNFAFIERGENNEKMSSLLEGFKSRDFKSFSFQDVKDKELRVVEIKDLMEGNLSLEALKEKLTDKVSDVDSVITRIQNNEYIKAFKDGNLSLDELKAKLSVSDEEMEALLEKLEQGKAIKEYVDALDGDYSKLEIRQLVKDKFNFGNE